MLISQVGCVTIYKIMNSEVYMDNNICLIIDTLDFDKTKVLFGEDKLIKKGNVSAAILGNVYGLDQNRLDAEGVIDLYNKYGKDTDTVLDGIYTAIVLDYDKKRAYVFQDFFGSNQAIFYYNDNGRVYITNSLRAIVTGVKKDWQMNMAAVKQFILRGYSANSDTLIKGICKMPGKANLEITKKPKLLKHKKLDNVKEEISIEKYDDVVSRNTRAVWHEGMATTISSGYDSNYIMHNLQKLSDKRIDAFCIGGTIGTDEIPDAEKICAYYGNVDLHTRRVNGSSFDKLPEIVYAMEGCMYERGIFLQYELADLVSSHGVKHIMLGESADQVLNFEMYHPFHQAKAIFDYTMKKLPARIFKGLRFRPYRTVYDMATYIVTKKNGIMMNYFGVNPEYPYMRKEYMKTCENAVKIGEKKKEFHKKAINAILPEGVTSVIHKMPGSTELKDLFIGEITYEDILEICKKSPYYKKAKFDDCFYEIDNYLKITYLEVFRRMFIEQPEKYLTDKFEGYTLKDVLFS